MPLIGTTGAASARGFGFTGLTGAPSYIGTVLSPVDIFPSSRCGVASDSSSNVIFATFRYVMKYAPSGALLWSFIFSGTNVRLFAATTASNGDIYVAGSDGNLGFIAKLNSSGALQWQRTQNAGTSGAGYARNVQWRSIVISPAGLVNVAGIYNDNINYTVCTCCGPVNVKYDVGYTATAQYNTSGTFQWGRKFGVTSMSVPTTQQGASGISVDSSNNLYVSGTSKTSAGVISVSVFKYNSSGTQQWGYIYRNDTYGLQDFGIIAADSSGNCYVASAGESGPHSVFSVDTSGTLQWGKNFTPEIYGIGIDSNGSNFYIAGRVVLGSPYFQQVMLSKVSSAGNIQFVRSLGKTDSAGVNESAYGLAISPDGNMVFGGPTSVSPIHAVTGKLKTSGAGIGTYVASYTYDYAANASTLTAQTFTRSAATATQYSSSSDTTMTLTEATPTYTLSTQAQSYSSTVVA